MKQFIFSAALVLLSIFGFAQTEAITTIDSAGIKADSTIFHYAEVMPTFPYPGGFNAYLAANIKYPDEERQKDVQGTVYVSFVVETNGSLSHIKIVKDVSAGPGFSRETLRVVKASPKWTAGRMNGKPVRVEITQPVRFHIPSPPPSGK